MQRRTFLGTAAAVGATAISKAVASVPVARVSVVVQTRHAVGPLHHVWSQSTGSDRAAITLRESWRKDLDRWVSEAGCAACAFTAS